MTRNSARLAATLVLAPCIAFWLWFGIASAIGEELGGINWVLHLLLPGGGTVRGRTGQ